MTILAVLVFTIAFVMFAGAGTLLFYRPDVNVRFDDAIAVRLERPGLQSKLKRTSTSLSAIVKSFETFWPKSRSEAFIVQSRLARAGYREESAVKMFYGAKALTPVILCGALISTGYANFILCLAALGLGFLLPDFWLGSRIKKRQKKIRLGLPDVLDLLVICVEAGLGLDQAVNRTVKELYHAQPEICDELSIVVLEQRAGKPRVDAWKSMAERTDVDSIKNFVSTLIQSEQFGTGIAKTLRIHSETLRTERVQMIEEMAAKTTIKLIFPLVFFIFPSLFVVTLGPAVILMVESFDKFFQH